MSNKEWKILEKRQGKGQNWGCSREEMEPTCTWWNDSNKNCWTHFIRSTARSHREMQVWIYPSRRVLLLRMENRLYDLLWERTNKTGLGSSLDAMYGVGNRDTHWSHHQQFWKMDYMQTIVVTLHSMITAKVYPLPEWDAWPSWSRSLENSFSLLSFTSQCATDLPISIYLYIFIYLEVYFNRKWIKYSTISLG